MQECTESGPTSLIVSGSSAFMRLIGAHHEKEMVGRPCGTLIGLGGTFGGMMEESLAEAALPFVLHGAFT
jgi:hypothetical protein